TSGAPVDVGDVDMRFDLTGLGTVTASDLRLLIDTDNDGVFSDETVVGGGIISGATSLAGNVYEFSGVSDIADNLRFTLGSINVSQTPLPIELTNFSVKQVDSRYVQLDWQTDSETNNDYFTIEKSEKGQKWIKLKEVQGAGNSSTSIKYSEIDKFPYFGISYYRLKQTDFSGQFEYSEIRSVEIENDRLEVYPNPTHNQIVIIGEEGDFDLLKIYNLIGQDVTRLVKYTKEGESKLLIDMANLGEGVYYIKTKTSTNKVIKL
ncbi:MAG: T9SS type A sorting domain-containing protein, partial [Crocinitomicaceae bacterium]